MVSVGIDVSKGKSMFCVMRDGDVAIKPQEIQHTKQDVDNLIRMLSEYGADVRIVMEATGKYHLPLLISLKNAGFFVSVINPLIMKKYSSLQIRKGKTDKIDSKKIAKYGVDNWKSLRNFEFQTKERAELQLLGRQYAHYVEIKVAAKVALITLLDQVMPEITNLLSSNSEDLSKDKLVDFVEEYWHYSNILDMGKDKFCDDYCSWAKKLGYHANASKAGLIYTKASESIPTLNPTAITKMLVLEACRAIKSTNATLYTILSNMNEIATSFPEYGVVRSMNGVGNKLAVRLIAEIGDVMRFKTSSSLIAYAGLDSPPFESGNYVGTKRKISKRGSKILRKTGYEVMSCLKTIKPESDNAVYLFIQKKIAEGKPNKVAKIAGLNKFLRIYYARVKECNLFLDLEPEAVRKEIIHTRRACA